MSRLAADGSLKFGALATKATSCVASPPFMSLLGCHWRVPRAGSPSPIPEEDKAAVRDNLLEGIVRAPQVVRTQLGECLKAIVHVDFPESWPGLLPIVLQNLGSQVICS